MPYITLTYPRRLRQLWKSGKVHEAWFWEYEGLFDKLDFKNANDYQHRAGRHFGEWFVAIHFFRKGYKVLTPKYALPSRIEKRKFLSKVLDKAAYELLVSDTLNFPDLFVYDAGLKLFFFVEVKVGADRLSAGQKASFPELEKKLGCQVLIVNLKGR